MPPEDWRPVPAAPSSSLLGPSPSGAAASSPSPVHQAAASGLVSTEEEQLPLQPQSPVLYRWLCTSSGGMESLFPAPFWEVLYSSHLQGNLSLLSPNHSLLPPHLLLNTSHGAFLPLGLKVTIVGLYLAVCIGGLLGNCLVMYVILR
ncbi:Nociceptin receptor [Camelus dromedarius]|uniref:Nociceptin receptor n=1 Tax=Camelus dromedarius TaxID=9838 RepID=A0A5N4CV03_CAMDR|nr:Nociceptin receptor [Camelus dromedarius]